MSVVSEQVRSAIVARAAGLCEYCRIPAQGQVGRFPIDHVIPRNRGGQTEMENLALACPHCNGHKWAHTDGIDPETGVPAILYNPRTKPWREHFRWSEQNPCIVEGTTASGRATIARLQLNHPDLVNIHHLLAGLGLFPRDEE